MVWARRTNTHAAVDSCFLKTREIVQTQVSDLPQIGCTLDLGYVARLPFGSRPCEHVSGIDLRKELVNWTTCEVPLRSITHVEFITPKRQSSDLGTYDLVCCPGLTSGIPREHKYQHVLDSLPAAVTPGGLLLTFDTLGVDRQYRLVRSTP